LARSIRGGFATGRRVEHVIGERREPAHYVAVGRSVA
jgi:hypothetical protein